MADGDGIGGEDFRMSRRWTPARSGHIACCVDKYLLIWGGYQDDTDTDKYLPSEDLWVYHTELKCWMVYKTKGQIPKGTSGAGSYLIDGFLYVFAGHNNFGNICDIFRLDLQQLEWEKILPLNLGPSPRDKFTSWTHDNRLYCFGGFGPSIHKYLCDYGEYIPDASTFWGQARGWNNQLLFFDIDTESWSNPRTKGPIPCPRAAHATTKLETKVYVFGGRHLSTRMNDVHCLDMHTLKWSGELCTTGPIPCGRSWHSLTPVTSKCLFMYGGYSNNNVSLSDAWVLDVVLLQWTELQVPQDRPRLWHTASFVNDSEVLVFGGCCNDILNYAENAVHSSEILVFHFQPYTLVRLCLEMVYRCRKKTESGWSELPRDLRSWLISKSKSMTFNEDRQVQTNWYLDRIENNYICAIS